MPNEVGWFCTVVRNTTRSPSATRSSTVKWRSGKVARVFVLLLASQSSSLLGSRMSAVAVGLWLFTTTGAVTPLALTALAAVLPRVLFTGPAGLLADHCDRRRVLLGAEVLQALASLLLLLDLVAGTFVTWHLYALTALQAAGAALQEPALLATTTQLVPLAQRTRANALQQLGGPLAAVLAPALAGLVLRPWSFVLGPWAGLARAFSPAPQFIGARTTHTRLAI